MANMLSDNLLLYGSTNIWIDIFWLTFVIVMSPAMFVVTMAINELPVVMVRKIIRIIRTEPKRFQSLPLGSMISIWFMDNRPSQ